MASTAKKGGGEKATGSVTAETVTMLVVKGLLDRDAVGKLTPSEPGRAALASLLKDH